MIKTRTVRDRRSLRFGRLEELLRDVEMLEASAVDDQGRSDPSRIRAAGNWTPAQIVWHVAAGVKGSIDGYGFTSPWYVRVVGPWLKGPVLNRPMRAGLGSPKGLLPPQGAGWTEAVAELRRQIGRVASGTRMAVRSPAFGELVHEEWIQFHCRHAEMHFSFLHPAKP